MDFHIYTCEGKTLLKDALGGVHTLTGLPSKQTVWWSILGDIQLIKSFNRRLRTHTVSPPSDVFRKLADGFEAKLRWFTQIVVSFKNFSGYVHV